jgi:transposase
VIHFEIFFCRPLAFGVFARLALHCSLPTVAWQVHDNLMDALAAVAAAERPFSPPAHQRLTELQRWSIIALHNDGRSNAYIAKRLRVHRHTVRRVLRRWRASGAVHSGARRGRPRCTDEALDTAIAFTARVDIFTSARQVRRKLQLETSISTIDRRLQEAGLFGHVAAHKRAYSEAEVAKRLSFAEGYKGWSKEKWSTVLFSDEKCFYGKGFCGRIWVRREKGERYNPMYTVHKTAHPVKVNVWACFCGRGAGYIYIFNETMDAVLMKKILSANLLPSAALYFEDDPPEQWWLLHDNDKKFTSGRVKEFLHSKGVSLIDFPPYSPDLNPMENLWATLQRAVEKHQCETEDELQDCIADEWENLDQQALLTLADSMPARCQAVIAARGWHTKY